MFRGDFSGWPGPSSPYGRAAPGGGAFGAVAVKSYL